MDVHRCRFVEYPPSTINAVAFSHTRIAKSQKTAPLRLAVGRANGDIEIWNPSEATWLQETIIRGGIDRSVDGLVWIHDPNEEIGGKTFIGKARLFSIGYTTTVTEWDLANGRPLQQTSGSHAEIWCLAAQPPIKPSAAGQEDSSTAAWQGQNLIAGCMDGALVLYSTKDGGLTLQKVLTRPSAKKAKIVSVVWKDRFIVVAGCSDSTIRIYDTRTGALVRNMTLGSGPKGGPKEIIVWSVKVLENGNIVSGDSTGEIKIWDGKTYTLMQRVKSHTQDVLSLTTSPDGTTIFSGGMDRKTVVYKRTDKGGRWQEIAHRRYHAHDVKTMASFEGRGLSVVVSGGPDTSPIVLPMKEYGYENHRTLPFLPQEQILQTAPKQRLLMSWWEREVYIWRLSRPSARQAQDKDSGRKLVAKILIKGEANITAAALSEDGTLVAISTNSEVKLFQLRQRKPGDGEGLKVSKIQAPASFSLGARELHFSPDSKWLSIIQPNSHIIVVRMVTSTASANITIHTQLSKPSRLDRGISKLQSLGGLGAYERTITQVAFSADSRILAVSDLAGYIDTFVLFGQEDLTQLSPTNNISSAASSADSSSESDSDEETNEKQLAKAKLVFGQHWTRNPLATSLPKIPSTPVVLSFRAVSTPHTQSLTNGHTPPATRHNPKPISHDLPVSEDRLFVITAKNDFYEFEVLKGALSPWSRRNPTAASSDKFRLQKDLAKGAFWEVSEGKERIWVYSFSWMWMFDLSRDLPADEEEEVQHIGALQQHSKKRKRAVVQGKSGAGSAMAANHITTGISRKMKITEHDVSAAVVNITQPEAMDIDEDEAATQPSSALSLLRRGSVTQRAEMDDATRLARVAAREGEDDEFVHEWATHKYKPILGMCIIAINRESAKKDPAPENETAEEGRTREVSSRAAWKAAPLEIVLVERPIWEADLPDRFEGDQEWVKKDYVN